MIPYLYESTETEFTSNGIGRLVDALDCKVAEERNGQYELFLSYPIDGAYFSEITKDRIIAAVPAQGKRIQPFRIYRITKPLNGICSIYAEHISYELNHIPVMPFTASSCPDALNGLKTNSAQENPFSVWTDKTTPGAYTLSYPMPFRALLGGTQGSLLDVYGTGEYEFDRYLVRLWVNRGYDTEATIRYGKNLTGLEHDENLSNTITGIVPYWYSAETGTLVTLPEKAIWASTASLYPYKRTAVKDFSADFEEQPTVDQLRARANKYITDNDIGKPNISIKIEFVPLDQMDGVSLGAPRRTLVFPATVSSGTLYTTGAVSGDTANFTGAYFEIEQDDYNVLEHVNLCDTVTVQYMALGVSVKAEVIKTEWNVLKDRYNSIEMGNPRSTLASTITGIESSASTQIRESAATTSSNLREYVNHQNELITGGLGGYIVYNFNAAGEPQELLIMDTPNVSTAVNVIRINRAGIGFSANGYDGPYTSAWTIDGVFNADFIRAGTMLADRIFGGTLTLGGYNNASGVLRVLDENGNAAGSWTNDGVNIPFSDEYGGEGGATLNASGLVVTYGYPSGVSRNMSCIGAVIVSQFVDGALRGTGLYDAGSVNISKLNGSRPTITLTCTDSSNIQSQMVIASDYIDATDASGASVFALRSTGIRANPDVTLTGYLKIGLDTDTDQIILHKDSIRYLHGQDAILSLTSTGMTIGGNFSVTGTKNRVTDTEHFGKRKLYADETTTPVFTDIGEDAIGPDGCCQVEIEPIFRETISTAGYQVFLQAYGKGDCYVDSRGPDSFSVCGTPGLAFGWMLKARQKGYENVRLEEVKAGD